MKRVITSRWDRGSDLAQCDSCDWENEDRHNVGLKCRRHVKETGHKVKREYNVVIHYESISPQ